MPWVEPPSWELIWSETWVPFRSLMNVVNCPAFCRTAITSAGPPGAGDFAGLWPDMGVERRKRVVSSNRASLVIESILVMCNWEEVWEVGRVKGGFIFWG
ncbi:hypothetical protein PanWU01x14_089980 [Parasponia andersonii]|uniref:Uncharacterized protein n=1 Tax=Parasponia andersonii TaxID=3476 RepID=A0A2P5D7K8_PARAD|nr:hypothetical protein PanWU01x14_089980 [Parasponia andersonii]